MDNFCLEKDSPMPYFRKVFDTGKAESKLQRAVVYFCGLGCGDLYLNGELVDKNESLTLHKRIMSSMPCILHLISHPG